MNRLIWKKLDRCHFLVDSRTILFILVLMALPLELPSVPAQGQNAQVGQQPGQGSGGVLPSELRFRIVRAISGSKGSEKGGQFIIEDPRTIFYIPDDHQVVVYFEWEGSVGNHKLQGTWKNPEGKIMVVSDFDYEAKQRRFAGYWTLLLSENLPTGIWTFEAHVDGELAGVHNFQVVVGKQPVPSGPVRRLLTPAEIYQRGLAATVSIECLDANGQRLGLGSGFFVGEREVVTGFEVIDSATSLRVNYSDGRTAGVDGLVAWNRLEDWAVLRAQSNGPSRLERAPSGSWSVGDRTYSLDIPQEGSRTIVDGNLTGDRTFPVFGPRLNLSFALQPQASGSPLLNDYGEVIGLVVSRSLLPGSRSLDVFRQGFPMNLYHEKSPTRGQSALAVPVSRLASDWVGIPTTPLSELTRSGEFTPPLVVFRDILRGTLTRRLDKANFMSLPADELFEYSKRDGTVTLFIQWDPKGKVKSTTYIRLYDFRNRLLATTKPLKISLSPGRSMTTTWYIPTTELPAGLYRVDVIIDPNPVWRSFFRVTD